VTHECPKRELESVFRAFEHKLKPIDLLKAVIAKLYYRSYVSQDDLKRRLVCGCLDAYYRNPAPIVLAVEGSPPKGVIVLPSGFQDVPLIIFYSDAWGVCVIDPTYHEHFFNKLYALIAYAVRELCTWCFDRYAESVLSRRETSEYLAHLEKAVKRQQH
jgi:hypothetical protein